MVSKNLGQFRDGLIRQMGLPFHWLLPPCSLLHLGLGRNSPILPTFPTLAKGVLYPNENCDKSMVDYR